MGEEELNNLNIKNYDYSVSSVQALPVITKSAKFFIEWKTAKYFLPHLADIAATASLYFRLAISVLKNITNSPAKL